MHTLNQVAQADLHNNMLPQNLVIFRNNADDTSPWDLGRLSDICCFLPNFEYPLPELAMNDSGETYFNNLSTHHSLNNLQYVHLFRPYWTETSATLKGNIAYLVCLT